MMEPARPPIPTSGRPWRLEVAFLPGARDARGESVTVRALRDLGISLESTETRDIYLLDCGLDATEVQQVALAFEDPVVQRAHVGAAPATPFAWAIEVGFRGGVTDNVGTSARVAIEDVLGRQLVEEERVHTATGYLLRGDLDRAAAERIATGLVANPLIHAIAVRSWEEWTGQPPSTEPPHPGSTRDGEVETHDLQRSDEELLALSRKSMWALSLEEMQTVRGYFAAAASDGVRREAGLGAEPTDVEMEVLAQTWSEHCKHKIFNSRVRYEDTETGEHREVDSLFKQYIRGATRDAVGDRDGWLLSVFKDNAGVVRFTDEKNLVFKVETHNTPSALDPYGGAMTGIVGVNRDPFGTGRGADLLVNTWGYCFASPDYAGEVPEGLMHPRRIRDGVHQGVIDGGNQSGIPYGRGWECFDDRYLGKPLVYCGTVGVMPARLPDGGASEEKLQAVGDVIVMVGGRIGADGIHGATFSSQELHEESPTQAVQIGDPITQKKMTDFLLEARDAGLYSSLTDNGAGGLSSSVGEMAEATGGAVLDLEKAPLKYPGLQPWEILLSEAQERMTVAVPPRHLDAFLALAARREVDATPLGTFTDSGYFEARYGERTVALLEMEFLHEGWPQPHLPARWERPAAQPLPDVPPDLNEAVRGVLGTPDVASKESKARQYDHEVKARTVIKPFTGIEADTPADATVFLVDYERPEGVVLAEGVNPWYSDLDTHAMAMAVTDLAVRRLVAGGADPDSITALDNFCWPDPVLSSQTPDGPYKMAQLVRACEGLYEACVGFGVPLISGKDSMKNDSTRGGVKISIPPTLLVSAMGKIHDIRLSQTPEPKGAGDLVYVVGDTRDELGASSFARWAAARAGWKGNAAVGGRPPRIDPSALAPRYRRLAAAIAAGYLQSVKTTDLGGLAVALAFMTFGSGLGLDVDLGAFPVDAGDAPMAPHALLFSESGGRFLVTVRPGDAGRFEEAMAGEPFARVGVVTPAARLTLRTAGKVLLEADVFPLKEAWKAPLARY